MNFSIPTILIGMVLVLLQVLAAVPWLLATFAPREFLIYGGVVPLTGGLRATRSLLAGRLLAVFTFGGFLLFNLLMPVVRALLAKPARRLIAAYTIGGVVVVSIALPALFFSFVRDPDTLDTSGRIYGAVLQTQLIADFFVVFFPLLLQVWPKGGAIAQAAFREGVRQPMFWLLLSLALVALGACPFIPYFTFGEDYAMVKELGPDTIMLFAVIFGVLAASMFVSDEIEGRTAVTLMSKPVSRRQFLLGKFLGILLVVLLMFAILGTYFEGTLLLKRYLDRMDPMTTPEWVASTLSKAGMPEVNTDFLRGTGIWMGHSLDTLPGLLLGFYQAMVLVCIAVALATRVPMIVNLIIVLGVFLTANATPAMVNYGHQLQQINPGSVVAQLLSFVTQVFETVLPGLDYFHLGAAGVSDTALPPGPFAVYLLSVTFYALLYTLIVILFGLVLFEDRDVA